MSKQVWEVALEDGTHSVELEHHYFSGKRVIRVDGNTIVQKRQFLDFGSTHPFQIGDHPCRVSITTNGLTFRFDLIVDGRSVTTGKEVSLPLPMPLWGWVFVGACALIPILALGGAVPALIGYGGGTRCYRIARDGERSTLARAMWCLAITGLCWVLFIGFTIGVDMARSSRA